MYQSGIPVFVSQARAWKVSPIEDISGLHMPRHISDKKIENGEAKYTFFI